MRRVVLLGLAVAAALSSACATDDRFLPVGEYAGSTSADQAFRISVGDEPKVNGRKAEWEDTGVMRAVGLPDRPVVKCVVVADGEELRCQFAGEWIELMKE